MAMQVSWIDADEIARLAAQLEGPLQKEEPPPWDLDVMPDFSALFAPGPAGEEGSERLADAIAAPAPEPLDQRGAAPAPEVEHIREKLHAIRSRAEEAGLLPPGKPAGAGNERQQPVHPTLTAPPSAEDQPGSDAATLREPIRIPPAPPPVAEAGTASPSIPPEASGPLLPAVGSLTQRLQAFMAWAQSVAPCQDILLVDDHGDLLWGGPSRADLALSVILAAGAGLRSGSDALTRTSVFIRSRLGDQQELSVLPCPTRFGMVTLALLNATSLSNETVARLREALTRCVDGSAIP